MMFLILFGGFVALLIVVEKATRPKDDRPSWHKRNPS